MKDKKKTLVKWCEAVKLKWGSEEWLTEIWLSLANDDRGLVRREKLFGEGRLFLNMRMVREVGLWKMGWGICVYCPWGKNAICGERL